MTPAPDENPYGSSKIQHTPSGMAGTTKAVPDVTDEPLPMTAAEETVEPGSKKITAFEKARKHEDAWSRTPNLTGTGAIHVKTFHSKLTSDALLYMDQSVNEWLDAHPQYEVKFVTSTVGTLTGKLKEPHLICQIWV